jgi:glucose-1-phosphatase
MLKTLVFDFGNVIGFFDHQRAVTELARFTDMNPMELALVLYGSPIEHDYEVGKLTTAEYVREAKLNGRLNCTDEEFLTCFCDIFWPNPEISDLIPRLKPHYRLILASNTNEAHFGRYSVDFAATLSHFDHLVVSHQVGARKPHSNFFAFAQRHTEAAAAECALIDDLPVNVEAAGRVGWKGITYRPGGSLIRQLQAIGVMLG